ncbi:MAG: ECF transporter S component [Lachnospiraceae bacterium]|nr:ECF transporter S component [Lachnospiraceae bacterium]
MTKAKTKNLVRTAMFAALTCIATFIIKIPTPGTGGYIHPGDALVILSGVFLGPVYGAAAAGLGSAMADIVGGYFFYAPVTLLIKGIIAFVSGHIFQGSVLNIKTDRVKLIACGLLNMFLVALGYLLFELIIYGPGAVASVPANLIQGLSGLIISGLLYMPLRNIINTVDRTS